MKNISGHFPLTFGIGKWVLHLNVFGHFILFFYKLVKIYKNVRYKTKRLDFITNMKILNYSYYELRALKSEKISSIG